MWFWKVRLGHFVGTAPAQRHPNRLGDNLVHSKLTARTRVCVACRLRPGRSVFRFALLVGVPTECGALLIFTQNIIYCPIAGTCFSSGIPVTVVREKRWVYERY